MTFLFSSLSLEYKKTIPKTFSTKSIFNRASTFLNSFQAKNKYKNVLPKINNKIFRVKKKTTLVAVFGPGGGFLGVGTSELIVIGAVAWLVLGPKRLYQLARDIGKISGEIKNVAEEARQTFQQAIDLEGGEGDNQNSKKKDSNVDEDRLISTDQKKKKTMKALDEMVKNDIQKTENKKVE